MVINILTQPCIVSCMQYISQCYVDNNFEKGPQRSVKIDNQIELEIEDTLSESWTVLSTTPHTVREIDYYVFCLKHIIFTCSFQKKQLIIGQIT